MFKRLYRQVADFFADTKSELKKVNYPTRSETAGSTAVVIVFVLIVGIFLALVDTLLVDLVSRVIN